MALLRRIFVQIQAESADEKIAVNLITYTRTNIWSFAFTQAREHKEENTLHSSLQVPAVFVTSAHCILHTVQYILYTIFKMTLGIIIPSMIQTVYYTVHFKSQVASSFLLTCV